ncbi:organoarsenical effux MFS transporter ArsJ [Pontiellaceae bacterium B1224]|nr:organoarsenical effux MFS transporter ArsJ [Pontiellaceae bacterium B1224]
MKELRSYAVVTGAYWSFMLTDGALRMLVLLYFHELGYSPVTLAFLFLFYEFFGIITNLFGGWLAYRFGLKSTLVWGLAIQPLALIGLTFMNPDWAPAVAIPFVMAIQALSGIAKDLTKMSSKTAVKFLVPADQSSALFKWVAILTGSKNAIKGAGFFVGGFLLQKLGFDHALWALAGIIVLALLSSLFLLPGEIGAAKAKSKLKGLFDQKREIKILSAARVFLFGARDIWFVVAIPVFLTASFGWNFTEVGTFMAFWVIGYGAVQAFAPAIMKHFTHGHAPGGKSALVISLLLTGIMTLIAVLFARNIATHIVIVGGLLLFGAVFALNSSVHSFLVLDYADGEKAAVNVGFYYMANAMGRLIGTLFSGLLFQWGGVLWALTGSAIFLGLTSCITAFLPKGKSA